METRNGNGMKRLGLLLVILVVMPMVLACGVLPYQTTRVDTFSTGREPELMVDMNIGRLTVVGGSDNVITVRTKMRQPRNTDFDARAINGQVQVTSYVHSRIFGFSAGPAVEIEIHAPPATRLIVDSGVGDVQIDHISGGVKVQSGTGNIEAVNLAGDIQLAARTGRVTLGRSTGSVKVTNGTGEVRLFDVQGLVNASTSTGNVRFEGWLASEGMHSFESRTGNVTIELLGPADLMIDARTGTGSVRCPEGMEQAETDKRWCSGVLGAGTAELWARTNTGNITIR